MTELKVYKHPVEWVGFDGRKKKKDLTFMITKTSIIENFEDYQSFTDFKDQLFEMHESGTEFLNSKDALMLLDVGLLVIKLAYAEIDFENDIVDKTDVTVQRFQSSLAYEALMTQILDDPPVLLEIMNNIAELIPQDEETKKEISKLQQEYIERTKIQNGNNVGQTVVETDEEKRIRELKEELNVLQGGKQ